MYKEILHINDLITYIKNEKNISLTSSEEKRLKQLLQTHNYLNVLSLKYLFASGTIKKYNSNNIYRIGYNYKITINYKELEKQYLKLLKLEKKLREAVLMYETELKSHFIFFLQDFFQIHKINFNIFLNSLTFYDHKSQVIKPISKDFVETIISEWEKNTKDFSLRKLNSFTDYHLLIKILTFGTIGKLLDCDYEGKKVFYLYNKYLQRYNIFSIGKKMQDLRAVTILRNSLCHKESLIIFLEKGIKKNKVLKKQNKKITEDYLQSRINAVSKIYEYYYLRLGKKKKLKNDSWIKDYRKYRLSNGENGIKFKKIKIDV